MKRDSVDEILTRYFEPATDAGDLARRVLQAARESAWQTTRLLDSLSIRRRERACPSSGRSDSSGPPPRRLDG